VKVLRRHTGAMIKVRAGLALTTALSVLVLVGCGSDEGNGAITTITRSTTNGAFSYVGQATNAEVFIQWTRAGNGLTGSLHEVIRGESGGSGLESFSRAFTGTIDGDGITLTLAEGLASTSALVGMTNAYGFELTLPGAHHLLVPIKFFPGHVADYNHAVRELEGRAENALPGNAKGEASGTTASEGPTREAGAEDSTTGKMLNMTRVEMSIEASILRERNIHSTVTCPASVEERAGNVFTCYAEGTIGAAKTPYRTPFVVTQVNNSGYVTFHS